MTAEFTGFGIIVMLVVLYLLYRTLYSMAKQEPILPDQDYTQQPNGDLTAPNALFDASSRTLILEQESRSIPFSHIQGVFLRGLPRRRIGIGVVLDDGEEVLISYITDNALHRAARNAELIAEMVAGQGAALHQQIENSTQWRDVLMGTPFIFHFNREPA